MRIWEALLLPCCALALLSCCGVIASAQEPVQEAQATAAAAQNDLASSAICQIVYKVDEGVPSPHGYRYIFYGNGFFVDKDGYVLTAAHVLSQLYGGQPYLLLHDGAGKVQFVKADVAALDRDHDIAVLHATPNPFKGNYAVSFLPLDAADATPGETVSATSFSPSEPRDAFSLDPIRELQSRGQVLRFEFSELDKGAPDTQLFLFNHDIEPGQSGSPVISAQSHGVAGLVEGQWLRDNSAVFAELSVREMDNGARSAKGVASVPGAVVPIHYALALLQGNGIAWQEAPSPAETATEVSPVAAAKSLERTFDGPAPLSLVGAPYPASLFGGEVLLDATVESNGTLSSVQVLHGDEPFVKQALDAVRTWTFVPSPKRQAATRIAIAFQFPQPYVPPRKPTVQHFTLGNDAAADAGSVLALQSATNEAAPSVLTSYEPNYPVASNAEGSVILYESIGRDGQIADVRALSGDEPLRSAAITAAREWQFAPAKRDGTAIDAAAIVVVTFRQPLNGAPAAPRCAMQMCGEKACLTCNPPDSTQKGN